MAGQVRRQPAPRPPPGEQGPPATPDVAGRAKAVQQHQERLPTAALLYTQASPHSRSLPRAGPTPPARAPGMACLRSHFGWLESAIAGTLAQSGAALATFTEGVRGR